MGEFDEVEVRNRFTGAWGAGFELQDSELHSGENRFKLRRRSDGVVIPGWFSAAEIRPPQSPRDVDALRTGGPAGHPVHETKGTEHAGIDAADDRGN